MFGDIFDTVIRLVGKLDAVLGAGRHIHVVVANAMPNQQFHLRQLGDQGLGKLDHVDENRIGIFNLRDDFGFRFKFELVGCKLNPRLLHLGGFPVEVVLNIIGHDPFDFLAHNFSTPTQRFS